MQWLWCDCHTVTLLSRKAPLHISCHWPRSLTLSPGPHYGQHQALHYQPPGHSGPWEQQHYQYKVEEKAIFVNIHKIKLIEEGQVHQEAAVGSPRFSTSQAPPPPRPWQQAPCATRPRTLRPLPAPGEQQIWILMWSKIFIFLFCCHPLLFVKLNNRQTHLQTPAFVHWEIFFLRRKRSAWREKEARDLLRKDVQIHPSAPVMRWHLLWHVVFFLNLDPRDPDSSFDSSPALSPSKMESRELLSNEKNQRDARSVNFMSPFMSF